MTRAGLQKVRCGLALSFVAMAAVLLAGCSDEAEGGGSQGEAVECCMLKRLAERCESPNATLGLLDAIRQWRQVGNSGKADSCKALIESEDNGCTGPTLSYDEADAIVDCT